MKKTILLSLLLTVYLSYGQNMVDLDAVTGTSVFPQLANGFSAWGDYDGDGDLDLYFTGELNANSNGGGLYENDNGTFTLLSNSGLPMLSLGAADWGDIDNDGDKDVVVMGYNGSSGSADVYINNGNGTFTAAFSGIFLSYMGDVAFADYDGDGDLDIGLTGIETTNWTFFTRIYTNNGSGSFTPLNLNLPALNYGKIKFADYDNDSDMDFILHGWDTPNNVAYTKIWQNDGSNNFTEVSLNLPQLWLGDLEWGDVDNDGDLDLIISGTSSSDSEAHLMLNNNDGTFTDDPHFNNVTPAHRIASIELADFDNDGFLDFFVAGTNVVGAVETKIAKLYNNNGSGVFSENTNNTFAGVDYSDADVGDYDNDGKVDLFYTGVDSNNFALSKLYHNGPVVGINNILSGKFDIYPNPANNWLYISNKQQLNYNIQISDLTGKKVFEKKSGLDLKINVSNFPAGMYLLKIANNQNQLVTKLIIQ